jgi:hypothetical protein
MDVSVIYDEYQDKYMVTQEDKNDIEPHIRYLLASEIIQVAQSSLTENILADPITKDNGMDNARPSLSLPNPLPQRFNSYER